MHLVSNALSGDVFIADDATLETLNIKANIVTFSLSFSKMHCAFSSLNLSSASASLFCNDLISFTKRLFS